MRRSVQRLLATAALIALAAPARAVSHQTLLDPAEAFRRSASALDADRVEFRFRIAKGYYMYLYRDRFRFETEDGREIGRHLGPAEWDSAPIVAFLRERIGVPRAAAGR